MAGPRDERQQQRGREGGQEEQEQDRKASKARGTQHRKEKSSSEGGQTRRSAQTKTRGALSPSKRGRPKAHPHSGGGAGVGGTSQSGCAMLSTDSALTTPACPNGGYPSPNSGGPKRLPPALVQERKHRATTMASAGQTSICWNHAHGTPKKARTPQTGESRTRKRSSAISTEDNFGVAQLQQSTTLLPQPGGATPVGTAILSRGAGSPQHANKGNCFFARAAPILEGERD